MNAQSPDLFDLIARWDVEVKEIPLYLLRQGRAISQVDRLKLLARRATLKRTLVELRDVMISMTATYRAVFDTGGFVECVSEEDGWELVGSSGHVEVQLHTPWVPTDASLEQTD